MLPGLVGKAEISEEDEGAEDAEPASELNADIANGVCAPLECKDLLHSREIQMGIRPGNPLVNAGLDIEIDRVAAERDRQENLSASEAHKTHIATRGKVAVVGKQFVEHCALLVEGIDTAGSIKC